MKLKLRTQLSLALAAVALLAVGLSGLLGHFFVPAAFEAYVTQRQQQRVDDLLTNLAYTYTTKPPANGTPGLSTAPACMPCRTGIF